MGDYRAWERQEACRTCGGPVIIADGRYLSRHVEDAKAEAESLRQQLEGAVEALDDLRAILGMDLISDGARVRRVRERLADAPTTRGR